jgi:uncharacterized cupin superfamily protein
MPKLDLEAVRQTNRTGYPEPYASDVAGRLYRRIGKAGGLSQIGVSHVVLEPGAWSSQRHWHEGIDEFVVVLDGEAVLVEDQGEAVMRAGDCAAFPKDVPNAHHLVNRSDRPCTLLAFDCRIGEGDCHYPDADLVYRADDGRMTHKDGTPY